MWGVVTHAQWDQAAGLYVGGRLEHAADGRPPYMSGRDSRETHVNGQHAYMRVANVIGSGAARHQSLGLARGDGAARGHDVRLGGVVFGEAWIHRALVCVCVCVCVCVSSLRANATFHVAFT